MFPVFSRAASPQELEDRTRQSVAWLDAEPTRDAAPPGTTKHVQLPPDLLRYLTQIAETPELAIRERDRGLHVSPKKGLVLRKQLLDQGLLVQESRAQSVGRPRELLILTDKGRNVIGTKDQQNAGSSF